MQRLPGGDYSQGSYESVNLAWLPSHTTNLRNAGLRLRPDGDASHLEGKLVVHYHAWRNGLRERNGHWPGPADLTPGYASTPVPFPQRRSKSAIRSAAGFA